MGKLVDFAKLKKCCQDNKRTNKGNYRKSFIRAMALLGAILMLGMFLISLIGYML